MRGIRQARRSIAIAPPVRCLPLALVEQWAHHKVSSFGSKLVSSLKASPRMQSAKNILVAQVRLH